MKPEAFLEGTKPDWALPETAERQVCFCLMDAAEFHSETGEAILHDGRNLFVFGGALVAECSRRMYGEDLDEVCAAFRALSDKTKLMLLMRLSEGRSYCQQLAAGKRQQHRQHVPQSGCPDPARLLEAGAGAVPDVLYHGHRRHRPIFGEVQDLFQRRRNG